MKKILIIIFSLFIFTINVNAENIRIDRLGLDIDIPNDYTCITRDTTATIDLSSTGMNKYSYRQYMIDNYMYLDTIGNENYKLYIRAVKNPGTDFLIDNQIDDAILGLSKSTKQQEYKKLYTKKLQVIRFIEKDSNSNKAIIDYFTAYKNIIITFTVESNKDKFDNSEIEQFDKIATSIRLDGTGKIEESNINKDGLDKFDNKKNTNIFNILVTIFSIIIIVITLIVTKKRK